MSNTISVIIPCIPRHFNNFLYELIKDIIYNTRKPNEIIISLSESHKIDDNVINDFNNRVDLIKNDIKFIIVKSDDVLYAGQNRNRGFEYSTGDIIIFQDADDYIHNQRIEIIEYFFNKYLNVVCINHCFIGKLKKYQFERYNDFNKIKVYNTDLVYNSHFPNNTESDKYKLWYGTHPFRIDVTNGHVSIRRHVMDIIKFTNNKRGEDRIFLYDVLYEFKQSIIINAKLIKYMKW
jgi:glycosyltransferase involved in cell wall biosynthesis